MNKKYMNYIEKEVAKDGELVIEYSPTLEECEYLQSKGISITKTIYYYRGFLVNCCIPENWTKFTLEV